MIKIYTQKQRKQLADSLTKSIELVLQEHGIKLKQKTILTFKTNLYKTLQINNKNNKK